MQIPTQKIEALVSKSEWQHLEMLAKKETVLKELHQTQQIVNFKTEKRK